MIHSIDRVLSKLKIRALGQVKFGPIRVDETEDAYYLRARAGSLPELERVLQIWMWELEQMLKQVRDERERAGE